jgi:hypothetical protein
LQFGNLELEGRGGELAYAENYLAQAESLDAKNPFIKNSRAHLLLRKGVQASSFDEAAGLREQGSEILLRRIDETAFSDDYAVHIYCWQRYSWIRRWYPGDDKKKGEELSHLLEVVDAGLKVRRQHKRLVRTKQAIMRSYLYLGIPREKRPSEPDIIEV